MEVRDRHQYDADVDAVFALFVDPEAVKAKQLATGARNIEVKVSGEGDRREVIIEREVPADVPKVLQKFLGSWNKIVQKEQWKKEGESWRGQLAIDVKGAPLKIASSLHLHPEGEGSVVEVLVTINCSVPLLGKKLVAVAAESTRKSMADEYRHVKKALAAG